MRRVLLLIRKLNLGGAQRQLVALAEGLDKERFDVHVATFYPGGHFAGLAEELQGVHLHCLDKKGRWDIPGFLWRYFRLIRQLKPDICYSFLGGSNLLSVFARPFHPDIRVVWGVRGSRVDFAHYDWPERLTFRLESQFVRFADHVIANSEAGRDNLLDYGFQADKIAVVPNGINTRLYRPDPVLRSRFRRRLNIESGRPLVGIIGRADPMKGQDAFLRAAALVAGSLPDARFLLAGVAEGEYADGLRRLAEALGIGPSCIWLPVETEMPELYNGLDLLVSASVFGEGFSNVLGEAQACGVPCVATDVGDSRRIVGDGGLLVSPNNPEALAAAIQATLKKNMTGLIVPLRLRQNIVDQFSVAEMVRATEKVLSHL